MDDLHALERVAARAHEGGVMKAGEIKHLKTLKASEDRPLGRG